MDEIKQRLKEASDACVAKFEAWRGKPTDHAARESLQEAVHELRKVAARIEIELAVSDRKTQANDPIPIPAHRASRRPGGDMDMDDDNRGQNRQQGRDGNRSNTPAPAAVAAPRPVPIRKGEGEGPQPGNDAATGGDDDAARKPRPLSLKRTGGDSE